jgi:hypothetical protein
MRPKPREKEPTAAIVPAAQQIPAHVPSRQSAARYPNHVRAADTHIVSNLGARRARARVSLDLKALNLPDRVEAADALTGERVPLSRGGDCLPPQ